MAASARTTTLPLVFGNPTAEVFLAGVCAKHLTDRLMLAGFVLIVDCRGPQCGGKRSPCYAPDMVVSWTAVSGSAAAPSYFWNWDSRASRIVPRIVCDGHLPLNDTVGWAAVGITREKGCSRLCPILQAGMADAFTNARKR